MIVICKEWVGGIKNLPAWWKDEQEIEISLEKIIEIYNAGNNIMLFRSATGKNVLYVDNRRFTQR